MFTPGFCIFPAMGPRPLLLLELLGPQLLLQGHPGLGMVSPGSWGQLAQLVNGQKKLSVIREVHGLDPSLLDSIMCLIAPSRHLPPSW